MLFFAHVNNITCIYNITDIGTLASCDNTATNGYMGMVLLVAIFVIGLFGLMAVGIDLELAALSIGIVCTFIGAIMAAWQPTPLIDPLYLLVFVVVDILAFAAAMMKGSTSPYR